MLRWRTAPVYRAIHPDPGVVNHGGHCQSLLPLTNFTRQLPLVHAKCEVHNGTKIKCTPFFLPNYQKVQCHIACLAACGEIREAFLMPFPMSLFLDHIYLEPVVAVVLTRTSLSLMHQKKTQELED